MSPIEDNHAASYDQHQLEDSINSAIYALQQSLHFHRDLNHGDASIHTDVAAAHVRTAGALEDRLIDYQRRAEQYAWEAP